MATNVPTKDSNGNYLHEKQPKNLSNCFIVYLQIAFL